MTDLEKKLIECHYTERQRKVMEYYRRYESNVWHQPTYIQASQELWITMAWIYKAIRKFEKDGLLERNWRWDVKWLYEF